MPLPAGCTGSGGLRQALTAARCCSFRAPPRRRWSASRWWWATTSVSPPDCPLPATPRWTRRGCASVLRRSAGCARENVVLLEGKDADTVRPGADRRQRAGAQPPAARRCCWFTTRAMPTARALCTCGPTPPRAARAGAAGARFGREPVRLRDPRRLPLRRAHPGERRNAHPRRSRSSSGERVAGEGAVFLTSSSASEDSQESDEIKGSFFTHAPGLRPARRRGRERATGASRLDEAYRLRLRGDAARLEPDGGRHPAPHLRVRRPRRGDLVLATLEQKARGRAWLELPPRADLALFQDSADGPVVGEVGNSDRVRRLSLRAGRYFLRGRAPRRPAGGTVDLKPGTTGQVDRVDPQPHRLRQAGTQGREAPPTRSGDRGRGSGCAPPGERRGPLPRGGGGVPGLLRSITLTPAGVVPEQLLQHRPLLHRRPVRRRALHRPRLGSPVAPSSSRLTVRAGRSSTSRSTPAARRRHAPPGHAARPIWSSATTSGRRATSSPGWRRRLCLFQREDSTTGSDSFGPSFAVRVASRLRHSPLRRARRPARRRCARRRCRAPRRNPGGLSAAIRRATARPGDRRTSRHWACSAASPSCSALPPRGRRCALHPQLLGEPAGRRGTTQSPLQALPGPLRTWPQAGIAHRRKLRSSSSSRRRSAPASPSAWSRSRERTLVVPSQMWEHPRASRSSDRNSRVLHVPRAAERLQHLAGDDATACCGGDQLHHRLQRPEELIARAPRSPPSTPPGPEQLHHPEGEEEGRLCLHLEIGQRLDMQRPSARAGRRTPSGGAHSPRATARRILPPRRARSRSG